MGGLPTNRTVNGLAVNPGDPKIMYAAMRDGLFKSVDAGASWKLVGNGIKNVATVAINSKNPAEIFVSMGDGSVYVSADAGMKWKKQQ